MKKIQEDKPAVTFKDESSVDAPTDKTKAMIDEKVQEDKPAVTFKDES